MRRSVLSLVMLVVLALITETSTFACSCDVYPFEREFEVTDQIFSGTVVSISEPVVRTRHGFQIYFYDVEFEVSRFWKGAVSRSFTVETNVEGSACGYSFEVGDTYLVYAIDAEEDEDRPPATSICRRTQTLGDAQEDLAKLGEGTPVAIEEPGPQPPFELFQNYPNPFAATTRARYRLERPAVVTLHVYDLTGRRVTTTAARRQGAGAHVVEFDLRGQPAGVYVYALRAGHVVLRRSMVLLR